VPFQKNPRKLHHRHVIQVSAEEWEFARAIGQRQETPVSPHGVLLTAVRRYLSEKAREMRIAQAQEYDLAAVRRRGPIAISPGGRLYVDRMEFQR